MVDKALWKHRTKVYLFGNGVWHWKCQQTPYCCGEGGRSRSWWGAYVKAFRHTTTYGKWDFATALPHDPYGGWQNWGMPTGTDAF